MSKDKKVSADEDVEELVEEQDEIESLEEDSSEKLYLYSCDNCGSKFYTHMCYISTCVFCGSSVKGEEKRKFKQIQALSFVDTINDAKNDYKKKVYLNPFLPSIFRSEKTIKKIRKIYLPCMLYDIELSGPVSFIAADKINNIKNAPMQAFECGFNTSFKFNNLIDCSCLEVKEELFAVVNDFNYSVLNDFNMDYLKKGFAINSSVDKEENLNTIKDKITKFSLSLVKNNINHTLKKLKENSLEFKINSSKEILVPIYYLNVIYNDKSYVYMKNGQTGNSVIEYAIEKKRVFIFGFVVFVIVFIFLSVVLFLF